MRETRPLPPIRFRDRRLRLWDEGKYPAAASAEWLRRHRRSRDDDGGRVLAHNPDGVFLSNGPGDPVARPTRMNPFADLMGKKPIFGICLGHQVLGLRVWRSTFKLKFGHRGGNQPVKICARGKVAITSQNHGFAVDPESLPQDMEVTHVNLNDGTVEGMRHRELPIFSVQYHPEAAPGPHDASYFFSQFAELREKITGIVRSGRSLGMILHAENRQLAVPHSFDRSVVQINVRDFDFRSAVISDRRQSRGSATYCDFAAAQIFDRLVSAAMTELQFERAARRTRSPSTWCPRQIPKIGFFPIRSCTACACKSSAEGSPGRWKGKCRPDCARAHLSHSSPQERR